MREHTMLNPERLNFTLRDLVAIGFRQKRILVLTFAGIVFGVVMASLFFPAKYAAKTKILVKRERMDPVVTPEQTAPVMFRDTVSEEEINSEVELIQSDDVLRKVVVECGLDKHRQWVDFLRPQLPPEERIEKALRRLKGDLQVDPVKKTNLIEISYVSTDAQLSASVLNSVNKNYLDKHMEVNHPSGELGFFEKEMADSQQHLADAEKQLSTFSAETGGVAPQVERDLTLQKLNEFNGSLQQTRADIASTERRIQDLKNQVGSTPTRLTTQTRKADNPQVMQELKSTLMTLELKRTELLTKYQPTYPLVVEVDKQIAETKAAITNEETLPIREETQDQNPTYAWVTAELAKDQADLTGLHAREASEQAAVNVYTARAHDLEQKGIVQQDLLRQEKADEDSYLLYRRKTEESRIADALNRTHILNVVIAEAPAVPTLPARSPLVFGLLGILLAGVVSFGVVLTVDYMDQSFRTPAEIMSELNIPVLAAVPVARSAMNESGGNEYRGNGNGNGHEIDEDLVHGSNGSAASLRGEDV